MTSCTRTGWVETYARLTNVQISRRPGQSRCGPEVDHLDEWYEVLRAGMILLDGVVR